MNAESKDDIEAINDTAAPRDRGSLTRWLEKAGSSSLAVSLLVHGLFVIIALLIIWQTQTPEDPEKIDILSDGGGGGTEGKRQINETKVRLMVNRVKKTPVVSCSRSNFALPDTGSTLAALSTVTISAGQMSGSPGTGGRWGGGKDGSRGPGIGRHTGPGGGGVGAAFFGALPSGNNIIICIDTSGSMRVNLKDEGIAAVRRELKKVITGLPATVSFNLVCFGQAADLFKPQSVPASQESKNEALRFLEGYYGGASADFGRTRTERYGRAGRDSEGIAYVPLMPGDIEELAGTEGGSRIDLAMVAAFERNPTTLFVISDGAPGTRKSGADEPMDKREIIDLIFAKYQVVMGKAAHILVNTISIYSDTEEGREGEKFLRKLAQRFGGKHREVNPEKLK